MPDVKISGLPTGTVTGASTVAAVISGVTSRTTVVASTQAALSGLGVYTGTDTVSIGTATSATGPRLRVYGAITGAVGSNAVVCDSYVAADVTSSARSFLAFPSTTAAAFTLAQLVGFYSGFNSKGAGSTITSHIGFLAESSMTAATNNFGFVGNIAAATGCWNIYCQGTAQNFLQGNTGIGTFPQSTIKLNLYGSTTNTNGFVGIQTVQDCVCTATGTYSAFGNYVVLRPDTAVGTTNSGPQRGFYINATRNNTSASGTDAGTVTYLRGMEVTYGNNAVNTALTPATTQTVGLFLAPMNGYGTCTDMYDLYIAADTYSFGTITNHYAVYQASTTAKNYFAGKVGIGTTSPGSALEVIPGGGQGINCINNGTGSTINYAVMAQAAGAATTGANTGVYVNVNNASNNYGVRIVNPPAGANNWAIYSDSAAQSYFVGNIGIGTGITVPTSQLDVSGNSIRIRSSSSPTSAATAGNAGEIRWDSGYLYICTTTGAAGAAVWKRAALTAV
jgi:hypothetical protein